MNSDSLIASVLLVSVAAQLATAIVAFTLFKVTNHRYFWVIISFALALMSIRRIIPLFNIMSGEEHFTSFSNEVIGLFISILMLVGVIGIRKIFIDKVKQQIELIKAKELIEESDNTKNKLFSVISHDLRSPYNALLGFSNLLLDDVKQSKYDQVSLYAENINNAARNSFNLLNNLLNYSRFKLGRLEYYPQAKLLKDIVDSVIISENLSIHNKNQRIIIGIPDNFEVFADEFMLETIIRNIISNAIKFTPNDGEIEVGCEKTDDYSIIIINDHGVGMDKSEIDNIFDSNNYHTKSGTNKEKGSGLGLKIVKEFVDIHKGSLLIDSKLGEGTKFGVLLPNA